MKPGARKEVVSNTFMLMLGERLRIGEDVEIVALTLDGGHVRIGITAPRHVPVHRQETYLSIQRDGPRKASHS